MVNLYMSHCPMTNCYVRSSHTHFTCIFVGLHRVRPKRNLDSKGDLFYSALQQAEVQAMIADRDGTRDCTGLLKWDIYGFI